MTGEGWWRRTPGEAARLQASRSTASRGRVSPDKVIYKRLGNSANVGVVQHAALALFEDAAIHDPDPVVVNIRSNLKIAG